MDNRSDITGVILAGGRSSRMGRNKALLEYQGRPLVEYMHDLLKNSGIRAVLISGQVEGYECVEDYKPFSGPAAAIMSVMNRCPGSAGFLCMPVDMPLLTPEILDILLKCKNGGYFQGHRLPVFFVPPYRESTASSVREMIEDFGIAPVELPEQYREKMKSFNTPEEWKDLTSR
ncbi:MAG: molybdenum cofactor guanylyltransferase [Alphaproteobacteria bacterium]|nr:molybdenum cofactor guanylyltransferase [Alphaproteobacteria bacterium]MCB9975420.1 molybdenum cofactor guanylyltransferase [Rhodospirillales bacterium]